jgi:hypothetical protein
MDGTWADDSTVHIVAIKQAASFPECFIRLLAPAGMRLEPAKRTGPNVQTYTASLAAIRTGGGGSQIAESRIARKSDAG